MHFLNNNIMKIWFSIALLTFWMVSISEAAEDKTLNLQIGFDLTQGKNGAPFLQIRNLEDSRENNRRADDDETDEVKKFSHAERADSDSDDTKESIEKNVKAMVSKEESSDNESGKSRDEDDSDRDHKSTKGLQPNEYEPEENPNLHGKFEGNSDSDSDAYKRRFKRSIGKFKILKNRGKKFRGARKHTMPGY